MKLNIHAMCTIDSIRDGKHWRMGTGFVFVQKNWLVTAKHVVWDDQLQQVRSPLFAQSTDPSIKNKIIQIEKYKLHPNHDLAVLQFNGPLCNRPFYPAHLPVENNEKLFALGYSPTASGFDRIQFKMISISKFRKEFRDRDEGTEEIVEFDFNGSEGGNSGGPVFGDGAGIVAVIGHSVEAKEDDTGSTLVKVRASSIQSIIDSLEFKLDWTDT